MKKIFSLLASALMFTTVAFCADNNAVIDNIMTRSSVRTYLDKPVEQQKIDILLKAAMAAPTGSNKQPWEFVVLTDKAVLAQLPTVSPGLRMAVKAPLVIIVLGNETTSASWMLDCSAATQNLLLAAHSMGLGAVWTGLYSVQGNARMSNMTKFLNLPQGVKPLNAIVVGYPDKDAKPKDKWVAEKVHYNGYKAQ